MRESQPSQYQRQLLLYAHLGYSYMHTFVQEDSSSDMQHMSQASQYQRHLLLHAHLRYPYMHTFVQEDPYSYMHTLTLTCTPLLLHIHPYSYMHTLVQEPGISKKEPYGVATVSSIDKIIGLFCRIASLL